MSDQIPEAQGEENEQSGTASTEEQESSFDSFHSTSDTDETAPTGENPAWAPVLENIPDEFHGYIKPHLSKQDEYIQKVQSRYAPYKPLVENNIPIENIERAIQLASVMNSDPRAIWEELGRRFNFSDQGHEEQNSEKPGEEEEEEPNAQANGYDPLKDPRMQPYLEQQQQIAQWYQAQEEARLEAEENARIEQEWVDVEKTHGAPLTEQDKIEILQRTVNIAELKSQQTGQYYEPKLIDGYKDYSAFVSRIRGSRANNSAPDVLAGRGGLPSQPSGITKDMTPSQRQDYIAQRVAMLDKADN